jgi:acetyltransferase-like isoleucine patch superfamily enzyme
MDCEKEAQEKLAEFLRDDSEERVFTWPIEHPSHPSPFCPCSKPVIKSLWFYFKATLLKILLNQPYNQPKIAYLRLLGASIGNNVIISVGTYIDPLFPQLLTIEDNVLVGLEAKIMMHEFDMHEFRAGRIILKKGCLVGGFSLLRPGIEVGENATVAPASVVIHDVPPSTTALGYPARISNSGQKP